MYVRIVHPTIPADKVEAAAKHWASFMSERARSNPMLERGFMAATAFISMWVSNTATAAMMLPVCVSVVSLLIDSPEQMRTAPRPEAAA